MDVLQGIALMAATITMGIGAGVYLLFVFAIMPGLSKTDDRTFVGAFQQIDTAIVGPFLLVFFIGPLGFAALAAAVHLGADDRAELALIAAAIVLQLVMAGITLRVNVPLNNDIKAAGDPSKIDVAAVRERFNEPRWIGANNVRAVGATLAFGCLAWSLVLYGGS
ncbi:MAG: DUF1772 domain-containing protein [Acidimicrobiia bacterium]|nr:DUF1772 domain-containing protein [Acidimicrobiia bacterium]